MKSRFIRDLLGSRSTSTNAKQYAKIVSEKATLRKLIKVTEDITTECYLGKDDVTEFLTTQRRMFWTSSAGKLEGRFCFQSIKLC